MPVQERQYFTGLRRTHAASRGDRRRGHQVWQARSDQRPSCSRRPPPTHSSTRASPPSAIQALYYGNVVGGETEHQLHTGPQAASVLGIPTVPTTRFETACATSHAAFRHAVMEIASGVSDVVLVGGAERVLNVPTESPPSTSPTPPTPRWEQPLGLTFPGVFALVARAHMAKYGTTEEQMAAVAVKNHRHGVLNPKAQFQKEITLETGAEERLRRRSAQALRLLPVHRRRRRRRARLRGRGAQAQRRPIWVLGSRGRVGLMLIGDKRDLSRVTATERAAPGRLPAGGQDSHRRRRGRAARLLHDRRDRRHRGARPLRARHRRPRRREGVDEPRRQDPRQSVGRAQGQGTSDRRHRRRADRGDRHAAPRRGRPAPGRRRRAPASPIRSAATPPPSLVCLFGRD